MSSATATIAVTESDKLDLLFMIDDSRGMDVKQEKLRKQLPHLIQVLTSGDRDGDGMADVSPVTDLHLGVVTSDMGLPGVEGIANCTRLGKDGLLQHAAAGNGGCQPSYPPFLSFLAGAQQASQTASDFACMTNVGTDGCGYEHPLEAVLKALWPQTDSRVQFLIEPTTGLGSTGHGGPAENAGFLRNDPMTGPSVIAVVLLTDEDDCSASDTHAFTPPQYLDPNDPLAMQGLALRCHYNHQALYPIERYVNGLKALRPGNENLVVFAAITGVPQDLVSDSVRRATDFADQAQRDAFFAKILGDARMREVVDTQSTPDPSDDKLLPSCTSANGSSTADPPLRIVETARGFGENAVLASICDDDYGSAMDAIAGAIAARLDAPCLPRALARETSGLVDCKVTWELPPPGQAPAGTPTSCGGELAFLLSPAAGEPRTTDRGGNICEVAQLAVGDDGSGTLTPMVASVNGQRFADGWYYDDFSDVARTQCNGAQKQRIAFTPNAKPPAGITVKLACLDETPLVTSTRTDLEANVDQPAIGSPCHTALRGRMVNGDDACAVLLAKPTKQWPDGVDRSMFCDAQRDQCVLGCASDADCPSAWRCDASAASGGGRAFCAVSSCSSGAKAASNANVGQRCLPRVIPAAGFDDREAYVETSNPDCGGGTCLVYRLLGDPRPECTAVETGQCADAAQVADRVYCSCRCHAPAGYATCGCPDGYACVDALDQGGDEVRGGYCVKDRTYAN